MSNASDSSGSIRGVMPTYVDLDFDGLDAGGPGDRSGAWAGVAASEAIERARRERLVVLVSLIVALSSLGLAGTRWWLVGWTSPVAWSLAGLGLITALVPVLRRIGLSLDVVATLAPGGALAAAATMALLETGIQSEVAPWLPLMPLVGVLFLGRRGAVGFGVAAGLVVVAMVAKSWTLGHFDEARFVMAALRSAALAGAVGFATLLGWAYETLRSRALEDLRQSRGRTAALMRALPDMLVVLDSRSRVIDTNVPPGMRVPPSLELLAGDRFDARMAETQRERVLDALRRLDSSGAEVRVDLCFTTHDSDREFEARLVPAGGGVILVVLRDVSEARQGQRLRDEFVSVVSHELRTPLTAIRGSIGLLQGLGPNVDPAQREHMTSIANRNAERLGELIDDLLDMQKIESGRLRIVPRSIELPEFLQQCVDLNEGYAQRHAVELVIESGVPQVQVFADPERLGQVMANLLSNACKFSPKGSRVDIGADVDEDGVEIYVRDRGPGIPEAFHDRIFSKFAQADSGPTREAGGTGLGLHIARELCERMGGSIEFDSRATKGAVFYVRMPLVSPNDESPAERTGSRPGA